MNLWTIYLVFGLLTGMYFLLRVDCKDFGKLVRATIVVIALWPVWLSVMVYWTIRYYLEGIE